MARFIRSSTLYQEQVGDELVALDVQRGQCYGMNAVATEVWELLSTPRSIAEICDHLIAQFEVDNQTCQSEVSRLVDELLADGLVSYA
jgi:hypothetical protein